MIRQKREKLEDFIKEQTLGPGALGHRFVDWNDENVLDGTKFENRPIENTDEIINNAPAALYSTGILFPVDKSDTAVLEGDPDPTDEDDDASGTKENISEDIEGDEALSLNQMYPNTMGLTCCLSPGVVKDNDITVRISARYYQKIERKNIDGNFGLLLEKDRAEFEDLINSLELIKQKLQIREAGKHTIISLSKVEPDEISELKASLRELDRSKASELGSEMVGQYLSGFKEHLFRKLNYSEADEKKKGKLADIIEKIESVENTISHITDLINIYDSRGYGLWRSQLLIKDISLPGSIPASVKGKMIFSYKKHPDLHDLFRFDLDDGSRAALSMNIQVSCDSRRRDNNFFLKLQLVNTSTHFTISEGDSRYFSVFNEVVNQRAFFGVKVHVSSKHLIPYRELEVSPEQKVFNEDESTRLLYRKFTDYAIGHGCSVKWLNTVSENPIVETEYIPSFETPDVDPVPRDKDSLQEKGGHFEPKMVFEDTRCMQFKWLSNLSNAANEDVIEELIRFVNSYGDWIEKKKRKYQGSKFENFAEQELRNCENDKERMLSNIKTLLSGESNGENLHSFRLMNQAMFMQLWHSEMTKENKVQTFLEEDDFKSFDPDFYKAAKDDLFQEGISAAWRPFQLAFILLNLDGIFQKAGDTEWKNRNDLVDLVWFPTGGGKTEAYLGIIALTIIKRRKDHGEKGGGTAVIMRYTLRLLTLQQFQRATLLIMALELMRRWEPAIFGEEPIYVGLWVGKGSLPNNLDDLESEYKKIESQQRSGNENVSSTIPFENCPWCGNKLNPISYELIQDRNDVYEYNRVLLKCSSPENKCSFSQPLRAKKRRLDHGPIPVALCDEEIYQHPPALLFGTVDKFAQLAHKASDDNGKRHQDSRRLFGQGNWEKGKPSTGYLTPDLIIQDELHLLLGPLGSSVALFESAIDQLCTRIENGVRIRPKVVSSTATTRNTDLQILALFDRNVNLFPKAGVECDDSFFAFYKRRYIDPDGHEVDYLSKRKYFGILPTGRTQMWMQMRLSAILMVHRALFEKEQLGEQSPINAHAYSDELRKAMDYYHTVVSYFNSLKEIGKTESQINTYILKEVRRVFNRVLRPGKLMHGLYTYSILGGELTGRLSGEEVKRELERVSAKWDPYTRFAHTDDKGNKHAGTVPPDFVVATNMISVGIDVSRFNTIIMNSMPRNIAEYIQASSRVARNDLGMVLTVHHPFRARDISHYEKFIEFHEKMYSYVEPISITPFTKKAISRYLGLYLSTYLRHKTDFVNRDSAVDILNLDEAQRKELVSEFILYFQKRYERMSQSGLPDLLKNLLREDNLLTIESWINEAFEEWIAYAKKARVDGAGFVFSNRSSRGGTPQYQLYVDIDEYDANIHSEKWQIPQSLRVIEPEAAIKIYRK